MHEAQTISGTSKEIDDMTVTQPDITEIEREVAERSRPFQQLRDQIHEVVVGQEELLDGLIMGLLCNGHVLIEGVPGLAKTTAVSTLSRCISTGFQRIWVNWPITICAMRSPRWTMNGSLP